MARNDPEYYVPDRDWLIEALDAALADVGGLDGLGGLDELAAQEAAAWAEVRMLGATGADAPRVALIGYVFPLRHGQIARLELPDSGLDPLDADRLIEFIQSLVIPERMDRP